MSKSNSGNTPTPHIDPKGLSPDIAAPDPKQDAEAKRIKDEAERVAALNKGLEDAEAAEIKRKKELEEKAEAQKKWHIENEEGLTLLEKLRQRREAGSKKEEDSTSVQGDDPDEEGLEEDLKWEAEVSAAVRVKTDKDKNGKDVDRNGEEFASFDAAKNPRGQVRILRWGDDEKTDRLLEYDEKDFDHSSSQYARIQFNTTDKTQRLTANVMASDEYGQEIQYSRDSRESIRLQYIVVPDKENKGEFVTSVRLIRTKFIDNPKREINNILTPEEIAELSPNQKDSLKNMVVSATLNGKELVQGALTKQLEYQVEPEKVEKDKADKRLDFQVKHDALQAITDDKYFVSALKLGKVGRRERVRGANIDEKNGAYKRIEALKIEVATELFGFKPALSDDKDPYLQARDQLKSKENILTEESLKKVGLAGIFRKEIAAQQAGDMVITMEYAVDKFLTSSKEQRRNIDYRRVAENTRKHYFEEIQREVAQNKAYLKDPARTDTGDHHDTWIGHGSYQQQSELGERIRAQKQSDGVFEGGKEKAAQIRYAALQRFRDLPTAVKLVDGQKNEDARLNLFAKRMAVEKLSKMRVEMIEQGFRIPLDENLYFDEKEQEQVGKLQDFVFKAMENQIIDYALQRVAAGRFTTFDDQSVTQPLADVLGIPTGYRDEMMPYAKEELKYLRERRVDQFSSKNRPSLVDDDMAAWLDEFNANERFNTRDYFNTKGTYGVGVDNNTLALMKKYRGKVADAVYQEAKANYNQGIHLERETRQEYGANPKAYFEKVLLRAREGVPHHIEPTDDPKEDALNIMAREFLKLEDAYRNPSLSSKQRGVAVKRAQKFLPKEIINGNNGPNGHVGLTQALEEGYSIERAGEAEQEIFLEYGENMGQRYHRSVRAVAAAEFEKDVADALDGRKAADRDPGEPGSTHSVAREDVDKEKSRRQLNLDRAKYRALIQIRFTYPEEEGQVDKALELLERRHSYNPEELYNTGAIDSQRWQLYVSAQRAQYQEEIANQEFTPVSDEQLIDENMYNKKPRKIEGEKWVMSQAREEFGLDRQGFMDKVVGQGPEMHPAKMTDKDRATAHVQKYYGQLEAIYQDPDVSLKEKKKQAKKIEAEIPDIILEGAGDYTRIGEGLRHVLEEKYGKDYGQGYQQALNVEAVRQLKGRAREEEDFASLNAINGMNPPDPDSPISAPLDNTHLHARVENLQIALDRAKIRALEKAGKDHKDHKGAAGEAIDLIKARYDDPKVLKKGTQKKSVANALLDRAALFYEGQITNGTFNPAIDEAAITEAAKDRKLEQIGRTSAIGSEEAVIGRDADEISEDGSVREAPKFFEDKASPPSYSSDSNMAASTVADSVYSDESESSVGESSRSASSAGSSSSGGSSADDKENLEDVILDTDNIIKFQAENKLLGLLDAAAGLTVDSGSVKPTAEEEELKKLRANVQDARDSLADADELGGQDYDRRISEVSHTKLSLEDAQRVEEIFNAGLKALLQYEDLSPKLKEAITVTQNAQKEIAELEGVAGADVTEAMGRDDAKGEDKKFASLGDLTPKEAANILGDLAQDSKKGKDKVAAHYAEMPPAESVDGSEPISSGASTKASPPNKGPAKGSGGSR